MCQLLRDFTECGRCILGFFCCMLIIGPVLIIVGIVLLTSENDRAKNVDAYNSAVRDYDANDAPILSAARMTVSSNSLAYDLTRYYRSVEVEGNTKDVVDAKHYEFIRSSVPSSTFNTYTVTVYLNNGTLPSVLSYNIPSSRVVTETLKCENDLCTNGRCRDSSDYCSSSRMQSQCNNNYGGSWTSKSSDRCYRGDECGTCRYTGQLETACLVVRLDGGVVSSSNLASCWYPFDSQKYSSRSTSTASGAEIRVVSERDPYIALQRITEGSDDFGLTESQQRTAGIACLVVGLGLTAAIIGACCFFVRTQRRDPQVVVAPAPVMMAQIDPNPPAAEYSPTEPPHTYNNQGYPPQAGYGQQPPVVGQPTYGQPTSYPQQQPSYYGQPPPQQGYYNQTPQQQYPPQQPPQGYYDGRQQQNDYGPGYVNSHKPM